MFCIRPLTPPNDRWTPHQWPLGSAEYRKYYERCVDKLLARIPQNKVTLDYKDLPENKVTLDYKNLPVFTAQSNLTTSSRPDVLKKRSVVW